MNDDLPPDAIRELVNAAIVVGYDRVTRQVYLTGMDLRFKLLLPGAASDAPPVAAALDLGALNGRRLVGGVIPFKIWLQNAIALAGATAEAEVFRKYLAELEQRTTGVRIDGALPANFAKSTIVSRVENEKIILRDDMVGVGFLQGGLVAAQAVAKLVVDRIDDGVPRLVNGVPVSYLGTGWLIAPHRLITNHHVINARNDGEVAASREDLDAQCASMRITFDYDSAAAAGISVAPRTLLAWNATLDYAVIDVGDATRAPLRLARRGIDTVPADSAIAVNVIQHPNGQPKKFGIRNNLVSSATANDLHYFTDTDGGSSGSPVLDDAWEVVALHRGSTVARGAKFQGRDVPYVNLGTQIQAILADLAQNFPGVI